MKLLYSENYYLDILKQQDTYSDLNDFWIRSDLKYLKQELEGSQFWVNEIAFNQFFEEAVKDLANGVPMGRILGYSYIFGYKILCFEHVLIPRPDTETLIATSIEYIKKHFSKEDKIFILDLCTGTGVIAIAICLSLMESGYNNIQCQATDISNEAMVNAKENVKLYNLEAIIHVEHADLWPDKIYWEKQSIVVSNPPYLLESELQNSDLSVYEPSLALVSGNDGLDMIRRIRNEGISQIPVGVHVLMEHGHSQNIAIKELFSNSSYWDYLGYRVDMANRPRISIIKRK